MESNQVRGGGRLLAFAEVLLLFAAVHVTYRALMTFTTYGRWEAARG